MVSSKNKFEDTQRRAFRIWQVKERLDIPSTPEKNWSDAEIEMQLEKIKKLAKMK